MIEEQLRDPRKLKDDLMSFRDRAASLWRRFQASHSVQGGIHALRARWIERALYIAGGLALAASAFGYLSADIFQGIAGARLDRELRERQAATASTQIDDDRGSIWRNYDGGPLGRLEISRLHLSVVVAEGVDSKTLLVAAGHLPGTAFPGEDGNSVIAGHRDSFFRGLKNIREHDEIRFVTRDGTVRYRVDSMRLITPDQVDVLDQTETPTLTLITCYPFNYVGPAPRRFVVRASIVDPLQSDAGSESSRAGT